MDESRRQVLASEREPSAGFGTDVESSRIMGFAVVKVLRNLCDVAIMDTTDCNGNGKGVFPTSTYGEAVVKSPK